MHTFAPLWMLLAVVGCSDARLAPLEGDWVIDRAALAADPRIADLSDSQRKSAVDRVLRAHPLRLEFRGGELTLIDGVERWSGPVRVRATDGRTLQLAADGAPTSLALDAASDRLEVRVGGRRVVLQRVDTQRTDPLKGDPTAPASGANATAKEAE